MITISTNDVVGLLDNASVNVCEQSLQRVGIFFINGRWKRNAPYSPRLAPIEEDSASCGALFNSDGKRLRGIQFGFCWKASNTNPGGSTCSAFFNIYKK